MTFTGLCKSLFSPCLTLPCQENINLPQRVEIQQRWREQDLRVHYQHAEGNSPWAPAPRQHLHGPYSRMLRSAASREEHLPAPANELPRGKGCGRAEKRSTQASPGKGKWIKLSKIAYIRFAVTKYLMVIQTKNECIRLFSITSSQPRKLLCSFHSFVQRI